MEKGFAQHGFALFAIACVGATGREAWQIFSKYEAWQFRQRHSVLRGWSARTSQIIKAFKTRNQILFVYEVKCLPAVCLEEVLS